MCGSCMRAYQSSRKIFRPLLIFGRQRLEFAINYISEIVKNPNVRNLS